MMALQIRVATHRVEEGCYMDGHKRPNVVKYCNKDFLPLIASLQRRMAQWVSKGFELVHIDSDLIPGEKRVIAVF